VIMPRLKTDLIKIINNALANKLKKTKITWKNNNSMTIVLCSKGYPGSYKKNLHIRNINKVKLSNNEFIYHAGTKFVNRKLLSNGGRVLSVTAIGKDLSKIRHKIIKIIKKLNWRAGFYRKDIGWKIIKKNENN